MSAQNKENLPLVLVVHIGTLAATTTLPAFSLNKRYELKSCKLMDGAGVAADNTNFLQVSLKKGSTEIAEIDSRAAHEDGIAQNVGEAMNIVSGQEVLAAGDYTVVCTKNGTGVPTNAKLVLELVKK